MKSVGYGLRHIDLMNIVTHRYPDISTDVGDNTWNKVGFIRQAVDASTSLMFKAKNFKIVVDNRF